MGRLDGRDSLKLPTMRVKVFSVLLLNLVLTLAQVSTSVHVTVKVNSDKSAAVTSERFLSVTLDTAPSRDRWRNLKNLPKIIRLAKQLSPAYLRIGGTWQDYLHWDETGKDIDCFNATELDLLYEFAQYAELDLVFGLASLIRNAYESWDSENAQQLLDYMNEKGYTMDWELGNEPDLYPRHNITNISAEQLAKDFGHLKVVLQQRGRANERLLGPDVATLFDDHDFLTTFLTSVSCGTLDAVTYHQYYENSYGAKLEDFINVTVLDEMIAVGEAVLKTVYTTLGKHTPIWLGETSSTYNGGAAGLSNSYIAGFMWLDKLGVAALFEHSVVCRQAFYGGNYALLDFETLDPWPDYWTSVLYKRLVGPRVLMVEDSLQLRRKARIYAHCTRITEYYDYEAGAITLIVLNLYPNEIIELELPDDLRMLNMDQFLLEPDMKNITSQTMMLNGKVLELGPNYHLPHMYPVQVEQPVSVPSLTYGLFVVPKANAKACMADDISSFNKVV